MTAVLTTLLISLGFAPADARDEPCKMPAWTMSKQLALVCDFEDARAAGTPVLTANYRGARTRASFVVTPLQQQAAIAIIHSDRTVPLEDASQVAIALGPWGGWVDSDGVVHGAGNAWMLRLKDTPLAQRPAGTVVYLMPKDFQK